MWIFVAAVVVVAVGALVVAALMRPGGDDTSVRSYHSALGTLEHLAQPERRVRRPVGGGPAGPAPPDDPYSAPPVSVRDGEEHPEPGEPLVFDDARPKDRYRSAAAEATPARARRAQKIALDSMDRRPRRGTGIAVVVVALVAFAALAYVGSRRSSSPTHASTTHTTHTGSVTTTTTHHSQGGHAPTRPGTSTTTTAPSQIAPVSASSTGTTATYSVPNASFTVLIAATAPCWVDVTTVATGATVWTGTLQPGGTQSVPATGATTVELGATGVALAVDGTPVVFPAPMHSPFVATFQPAASGTSPSTTTPSAG
jgi:hypothetical protein